MKSLMMIVLCLSTFEALAAPAHHTELAQRLGEVVREFYPDAQIVQDNGTFSAKHGTMIFTVHRHLRTGEILMKTDQVEGPNYMGFMLSVSVVGGKYEGPMVVPQTLRKPYWETHADRPLTADGMSHYVINFSYGSRLNKDFQQAIYKALPRTQRGKTE